MQKIERKKHLLRRKACFEMGINLCERGKISLRSNIRVSQGIFQLYLRAQEMSYISPQTLSEILQKKHKEKKF